MSKKTSKKSYNKTKQPITIKSEWDKEKVIWSFEKIDKNGSFAFNINDEKFDHKLILEKMVQYSTMTWAEVKQATHDGGRNKNHYLDLNLISKEAKDRLKFLGLEEDTDSIFSFAITNKLRIIGIRKEEKFYVLWYDAEHKVCISKKKHT